MTLYVSIKHETRVTEWLAAIEKGRPTHRTIKSDSLCLVHDEGRISVQIHSEVPSDYVVADFPTVRDAIAAIQFCFTA